MTMITKFSLASVLALLITAPATAQQPDWSQRGDYYAPGKTIVQQPTPGELKQEEEGDYYAPGKTIVERPTPGELNQEKGGDFYAPTKGN